MTLQRVSAVMPLVDRSFDPATAIPTFHEWIRERTLEGLPIDVARYGHVPQGPGIVLIGFEGDVAIEEADGVPALRYTLKRGGDGAVSQQVVLAVGRLVEAADRLHADLGVQVDRSQVTVRIADKLTAPNDDATRQALAPEVVTGVASVLGFGEPEITVGSTDPRDQLALTVSGTPAVVTA